jgi:hypothetical protein
MKYFKIEIKGHYREVGRIASDANGDKIPNAETLFKKMKDGDKFNLPVLDYFFLESFDKKEFWEWILCDVYTFTKNANWIIGWYISDDLKLLLENLKIAPTYHFYETRLLYKGKKLKYWIFQFPIEPYQNIDFQKSEFKFNNEDKIYNFYSEEEFLLFYRKEYRETKRDLKTIKVCLKKNYDIFKTTNNDIVVSEKLKNAIEETDIEGFEFSELNYEVVVEK